MEPDDSVNSTDPCDDTTDYIETEISHWLWKVIGPIIFLTGVTGNILVLWVLKRLKFTSSSTLVHLFILAMADTSVLCAGLTRYWINNTFQFDVRHITDFGCKFHLYFTYTSMDFSAWVLVSVTAERVVCVYFPLHVKSWCTVRRAVSRLLGVYILLSVINCHIFWSYGLVEEDGEKNCQLVDKQMLFYDRYVFVWVDLCFVSLVPFAIMLICNVFIIRTLRKGPVFSLNWHHSRTTRGPNASNVENKNTATTRLLLVVTTFFVCSTLPASLVYIVESFVKQDCDWKTHAQLELGWTMTYLLQFSNYAVNFILYTTRNHKFRKEVLLLFHLRKRRLHTPSSRTASSSLSLQSSSDNSKHSSSDRKHNIHVVHKEEPLEDPSSDEASKDDVNHVTLNAYTSQNAKTCHNKRADVKSNADSTPVSIATIGHLSGSLHSYNVKRDTSFDCNLRSNTCKDNTFQLRGVKHPSRKSKPVIVRTISSPDCHSDKGSELPSSGNLSDDVFSTKESASYCKIDTRCRQLTSEICLTNCGQKYTDGLEKKDGESFNTYL